MIDISITGDSEVVTAFEKAGDMLRYQIVKATEVLAVEMQRRVKEDKLSDQVLHVRSGRLRRSINQEVTESASDVRAVVGTNVSYGKLHEYGYHGEVTVKEFIRTIKRKPGAKRNMKRANWKQQAVKSHTRKINLPERSFLRSTLKEMREEIRRKYQDVARSLGK